MTNKSSLLFAWSLGNIEKQHHLEQRLCREHGIEQDLFMSIEERQREAYQRQLKATSYQKED